MSSQTSLFGQCRFYKGWVGQCKEPALADGKVCAEHSKLKCSCGGQALSDCPETLGPLVCGRLTCGLCTHTHRGFY